MRQYYQGKYKVKNYQKYKGDPTNVIYRSSWELKFLKYCDLNDNVLEFGSEEVIVPYMSPLDNRIHRYFPDFYIKVREKNGKIKKYLIEIKPKNKSLDPLKIQREKLRIGSMKSKSMPKKSSEVESSKRIL